MSKTLIAWNEPYAFIFWLRTAKEWLVRLGVMFGMAVVLFLALHFLAPGERTIPLELKICGATALVIVLVFDLPYLQRQIRITEAAVEWEADGVKLSFSGAYPHVGTARIELYRPGEWPYTFAGMKLTRDDGRWYLFALSRSSKPETVATMLTRLEIPVTLSDWEPTTDDTRVRVEQELVLDRLPTPTRNAVFTPIPTGEPPLLATGIKVFAPLFALSPTLLALFAMIGMWIDLGVTWSESDWLERASLGLGGLGIFSLGFVYMLLIGQFIEKSILIGSAKKALRTRTNSPVDAVGEDTFAVALYDREMWTKVISKSADFGFLQVRRGEKVIAFEGDKERWTIPLSALAAVRLEEAEVGKEGAQHSEVRYFVVIGTHRDGEIWEVGLQLARTQWGNDGATARRERMGLLFGEIRAAIGIE